MSKAEEKKGAVSLLKSQLRRIGVIDEIATKNLLAELQEVNIRSSLVESVSHVINTILIKRKQKIQESLEKTWKDVPE